MKQSHLYKFEVNQVRFTNIRNEVHSFLQKLFPEKQPRSPKPISNKFTSKHVLNDKFTLSYRGIKLFSKKMSTSNLKEGISSTQIFGKLIASNGGSSLL